MSGWRWNKRIATVITVLFLVFHLTLPTILFISGGDDSMRFGWQMFSKSIQAPVYTVETPEGEVEVPVQDVLASARSDLPFDALVPPHLCTSIPGAIRVTWDGGELEC